MNNVKNEKERQSVSVIISNIAYYLLIIMAVIIAFIYSGSHGVRNFFGYSYFTVLTTSMQSEIPQGSLVITKHVESNSIKIGDDITYFKSSESTVTHRVVDIYENYNQSGERGFQTKGIENSSPDQDIVASANVVGVVILTVPVLGFVFYYIASRIWLVFVIFVILIILSYSLKKYFRYKKEEKTEASLKNPND